MLQIKTRKAVWMNASQIQHVKDEDEKKRRRKYVDNRQADTLNHPFTHSLTHSLTTLLLMSPVLKAV